MDGSGGLTPTFFLDQTLQPLSQVRENLLCTKVYNVFGQTSTTIFLKSGMVQTPHSSLGTPLRREGSDFLLYHRWNRRFLVFAIKDM